MNEEDLEDILSNTFEIVEYNHNTYLRTPLRKDLVFLSNSVGIKAIRIENGKIYINERRTQREDRQCL
jgi:hypothetical protein